MERRGSSARADVDSAQADADFSCRFGFKMAQTRRRTSGTTTLKDQETCHKDCLNYYRNRTYLDMKYE